MVIEKDGYRGIASPVKLSRSKALTRELPPDFGADNARVLGEAGYSADDIDRLVGLGVVVGTRMA